MEKIRFFYTGSDLEEGMKYLKPLEGYGYNNINDSLKDYRDKGPNQSDVNHPAKCPALNRINKTGWVIFSDEDIDIKDQYSHDSWDLQHVFKNYENSDDWIIVKFTSMWNVNIPKGHYLFTAPVLYHTKDWFSLTGIIDPTYHPNSQYFQLNAFIMMKRDTVIPSGTPISQWILVQKPTVEIEYELMNDDDYESILFKDYLEKMKETDYEKYKQLKRSEFFKGANHG